MGTEENSALFHQFIERVIVRGDVQAVDELLAPDFAEHEPLPPDFPAGREGVKQLFSLFHQAFSNLQVEIEDTIAAGDRVVCRMTWRAAHTGPLFGIPPSGKPVNFTVIDIVRVKDGQLVEHWGVSDQLAMLQQIGAIPSPGA